jgi:hypothetical protein
MTRGRGEIDQHWQCMAGEVRPQACLGRLLAKDTSAVIGPAPQNPSTATRNRPEVERRQAQEYGY